MLGWFAMRLGRRATSSGRCESQLILEPIADREDGLGEPVEVQRLLPLPAPVARGFYQEEAIAGARDALDKAGGIQHVMEGVEHRHQSDVVLRLIALQVADFEVDVRQAETCRETLSGLESLRAVIDAHELAIRTP